MSTMKTKKNKHGLELFKLKLTAEGLRGIEKQAYIPQPLKEKALSAQYAPQKNNPRLAP